jgi:hypothetical protein
MTYGTYIDIFLVIYLLFIWRGTQWFLGGQDPYFDPELLGQVGSGPKKICHLQYLIGIVVGMDPSGA